MARHTIFLPKKEIIIPPKVETLVKSSVLSYRGEAPYGTQTSEAKWRITRTLTQGGATSTIYAFKDGVEDGRAVHVWDDVESLFPTPTLINPASLFFGGGTEHETLGDNYTFGPAQAFSWSTWVRPQNVSNNYRWISKTTQDSNVYGYNFGTTNTGNVWAQLRAPTTLRAHTFATALSALTWYHVVFTFDGSSNMNGLTAYINASADPNPASATLAAWTVTDPLIFGARGSSGGTTFHFPGWMNQTAVFNKELSSAEVTELYNGGTPGDLTAMSFAANVLSSWNHNDNSNFPTEVDQTGSVNATLNNMAADDYENGVVP